jgi:hypothetical protein
LGAWSTRFLGQQDVVRWVMSRWLYSRASNPPYHSKYNAIERYWAGLEKSWNGYLLSTVDAVIN